MGVEGSVDRCRQPDGAPAPDLDHDPCAFYFLPSDERGIGPALAVSVALAQLARALR